MENEMENTRRICRYITELKTMFPDRTVLDLIFDSQKFREPTLRYDRETRMTDTQIADNLEFYWNARRKDAA